MATTVTEYIESRETTDGESIERIYKVRGTASDITALADLKAHADCPSTYNGMTRGNATLTPEFIDANNEPACVWLATVPYAAAEYSGPNRPAAGEEQFQFDTGAGNVHITQSLSTTNKYPAATAADYKGAIGVTDTGIEGVDVPAAAFEFSITRYFANADVTATYFATLKGLAWHTNNASFDLVLRSGQVLTFAAGELLFKRASGGPASPDDWGITFQFAASPNVTGRVIGTITGIAKGGHEYLWVRYKNAVDATAKKLVQIPEAVYAEKVFESGALSGLGLDNS